MGLGSRAGVAAWSGHEKRWASTAARCLVLHDGSASSREQGLALANALNCKHVDVQRAPFPAERWWLRALPVWALALVSKLTGQIVAGDQSNALRLVNRLRQIKVDRTNHKDIIIGCGRRTAAASIGVKRALGSKAVNVQILNPRCGRFLTPILFDKVVIPQHDKTRYDNQITTVGALSWASDDLVLERERKRASLPPTFSKLSVASRGPYLVVLCGGDTARQKMEVQLVEQEVVRAAKMACVTHDRVFVVGSRRTPELLLVKLELLGMSVWRPPSHWISREEVKQEKCRSKIANPYRACIARGDAFVVTGDSVSMVSDACSTGKPVFVIHRGCDGNSLGSKLERFHSGLLKEQYVVARLPPLGHSPDALMPATARLCDAQYAAAKVLEKVEWSCK